MRAQLHFSLERAKLLDSEGKPIHVLITALAEEYWLFEFLPTSEDEITTWLDCFLSTWEETRGVRMAKHWNPIWIEIKPGPKTEWD